MNLTEFIEALGNVTHKTEVRRWLNTQGFHGKTCPLTCVCGSLTKANYPCDKYLEAASKLGISKHNAYKIALSADNHSDNHPDKLSIWHKGHYSRSLRNKMLVAVGLKPERLN